MQMYGKGYKCSGSFEYMVDTSANTVKGRTFGQPKITFENTKATIYFQLPIALISVF